MEITKFNATEAELISLTEVSKKITVTDLKDKKQIELCKDNRIILRDVRIKITKIGKELREDALSFQKAVITKEKELLSIITPEEDRLAKYEEEAKNLLLKEERQEALPIRKEKLLSIDGTSWSTDEELLEMDSFAFDSFYNACFVKANDNAKAKIQKEEDEKNRVANEEKTRLELEDKIKKDIEKKAEHKKNAEELEKQNLAKQKEFIDFKTSLGWTQETDSDYKIEQTSEGYTLYKKLGLFKK